MDCPVDRLRPQDILALCVLTLLCLGVLMVQSAAMHVTGSVGWGWTDRGTRHLVYAAIAVAAFVVIGRLDYGRLVGRGRRVVSSPAAWAMAGAIVLCAAVLVPGIGKEVNGARRWIGLGPIQVQPSEVAKWSVVLFLAWWLTRSAVDLRKFGNLLLTLAPVAVACLLIVIEDFGTAVLIGVCALAMLLCSGRIRRWHLLAFLPVAVAGMWWFIAREPYRMRRMLAFTDPWAAPRGEGYHMVQSLLSFSTGGLTGRGLGNGVQKLGYLPEDTTDFIFAVVCEELGLFGALLVLSLYAGILYVAWQVIASPREPLARMLALGIATMVGLQATINVAVATVSVPTKGLSLPLVSAGGSGLIIACGALGLLYGVCRWAGPETAVDETVAGNAVVPPAPRASAVTAPGESSGVSEADWREWTVTR